LLVILTLQAASKLAGFEGKIDADSDLREKPTRFRHNESLDYVELIVV
jgi:hypothetical protein